MPATKSRKSTVKDTPIRKKRKNPNFDINVNINVIDRPKKVGKTKIALVVDRSGSMESVREAAYQAINEQIGTIKRGSKDNKLDTEVLYIQFDDVVEKVFQKNATALESIGRHQYAPRNSTALRDAVWQAIHTLDNGTEDTTTSYLIIVISDGYENASKMVTGKVLADKIKQLQNTGSWSFVYMMSNVNLAEFSESVNAPVGNAASWTFNNDGLKLASYNIGAGVSDYLSCRSDTVGGYATSNFMSTGGATGTITVHNTITNPK